MSATRYAFCRMIETEAPAVLADLAANVLPLYKQRLAKRACRILNAADAADQTWLRQRQEEPDLYPDALERETIDTSPCPCGRRTPRIGVARGAEHEHRVAAYAR